MIRDPRGGHNRKLVNEHFFKTWTPNMAYVLGYLLADGAIEDVRKSSRTCYIQFVSVDKSLLDQVRKALSSDHNLYVIKAHDGFIRGRKFSSRQAYVLRIGNKVMFEDLASMGLVPKKAERIQVPEMSDTLFRFFLRGYFDGDGYVGVYKANIRRKGRISVIFTSCSQSFLHSIYSHLENYLEIINREPYHQSGAFRLTYCGHKALKVLAYMYQDLQDAPFLGRKYRIYKNYI